MTDPPETKKAGEKPAEKSIHQEDIKNALLNVMEDLSEVNAKNVAIIASIADGVIVVDKNGSIILMNHIAEKMLGWTVRESVGKKWWHILKREDKEGNPVTSEGGALRNALVENVTTLPFFANFYYYVRRDGTRFPVARTVSPIIIGKKVIGAVDVFRDITREKELDEMKDEFMDIAAHDLRTPAAAIRGFISRVLDGDAGEISDKAKELLHDAYEGNMRLIHLVDDFLVVSRLERGKIKIRPKAGDLEKIVEISISEFAELARLKGLKLEYHKVNLPVVLIDKERILEVINNLIGNAVKFTEKGGITISHTVSKNEVITNITDTGRGLSSDSQQQLFQKYYKVGEAFNKRGLGLGLYICKLYIDGLGGRIWVKSKEDEGSTFSFSLPIAK